MKKTITTILLCTLAILLIYWCIPKSCENKPSELQVKSDKSLKTDSIQKRITDSLIFTSNTKIRKFEDSIKDLRSKNEKLSINYYALRAKIKHLTTVKVDSSGQTVNVPVIEYNASINSGTMCDSLLMYQDSELMLKDSIISVREIQVKSLTKRVETSEQALSDAVNLLNEKDEKIDKVKRNSNRKLFVGMAIPPALYVLGKILKLY